MVTRTKQQPQPVQQAGPNENESLTDLASMAAEIDNPQDAPAAQAQQLASQAAQTDAAFNDLTDTLKMARDMAAPMVEGMGYLQPGQTRKIWTDAVLAQIAAPIVAIMERHGLDLGDAMKQAGPYVALIVGLWSPCAATWAAIQANALAIKGGNDNSQQQQQPA